MISRILVLLCSIGVFASTAHAGKWGMAGCGVGSLIFEKQPGKIQILAGTTNQYFVQSSSITSGTSNCTDDSGHTASLFITMNGESLKKDISRGNGETVSGLAKIYHCANENQFGQALQKSFGEIYPDEQIKADDVRSNIESIVRGHQELAETCKV